MTLDASGNLLVGTTSTAARLTVVGAASLIGATNVSARFSDNANSTLLISHPSGSNSAMIVGNSQLAFATSDGTTTTERARITSGGYFKASNTGSYFGSTGAYHELRTSESGTQIAYFTHTNASDTYGINIDFTAATPNNTTNFFLSCSDSTNSKCIIYSSGTISNRTGTYNTISDLKLKQDIVDASSQWDDIKALRIVNYRLKDEVAANPNYPAYLGVVAQEVEQVSPGLIDDCPDFEEVEEVDDEGNVAIKRVPTGTSTKSVKTSVLYMKAVKALQEAMSRIETLEAKIAALEAKGA